MPVRRDRYDSPPPQAQRSRQQVSYQTPSVERIPEGQQRPSQGGPPRSTRSTIDNCEPRVYHRVCPKGAIAPVLEGPPGAVKAVCPDGTRPVTGKHYDLYDQYGRPVVPVEPTRINRRHIRKIIVLLYILSIAIMIWDLVVNLTEVVTFYMLCNAILLFRMFGVSWLTRSLHFITFIVLLILFALLDWENTNVFNTMCCLIPLIIVMCISMHIMLIRPGRTVENRANRASWHALTGLLVVIMFFWVECFLINFNDLQCVLEMFYLLLFLIIVLTPHFQTKTHAAVKARLECERNFPECRRRFEPCQAPTCCEPIRPCCNTHQGPFVCPEPGGVRNTDYGCNRESRSNVRRTRSQDRLDGRRSPSRFSLCGRRKQRNRSEESLQQTDHNAGGPMCPCGSSMVPLDAISLPESTNSQASIQGETRHSSCTFPQKRASASPSHGVARKCSCTMSPRRTSEPQARPGRSASAAPRYSAGTQPPPRQPPPEVSPHRSSQRPQGNPSTSRGAAATRGTAPTRGRGGRR